MIEQEVIESKITRAQQVLDHIESPDFNQKRFLRLDQDISDRMQVAQFLQNYTRVGLIKQRLLEISLPKFQTELAEIIAKEHAKGESAELLVSPVAYTFDRGSGILQVGDRSVGLKGRLLLTINLLFENRGHTVDSADLKKVLTRAGFRSKVGQAVLDLEGVLGQRLFIRVGEGGRHMKWALGVLPEEAIPSIEDEKTKKYKESRQVFDIYLPDGQIIKVQGAIRAKALNALIKAEGRSLGSEEFAKAVYGGSDRNTIRRMSFNVARLQENLEGTSWQIKQPVDPKQRRYGQRAVYSLRKIEDEEAAIEAPVQLSSIDEILVIPYEPSAEEMRSEEETKILEYMVHALSVGKPVSFEDLQRAIHTEKRIRRQPGRRPQIVVYQANELKEMFTQAFRKLREEAEIPNLRENWNEQEEKLWTDLQSCAQRLSGNDIEDFIKKAKLTIERAEREFYSSLSPEQRQNRIFSIDL